MKFTYGQCFASIVQWIKTVVLFSWIRSVIQTFFIGKNAVWTLVACYAVRYMCSMKIDLKFVTDRFKDNLKHPTYIAGTFLPYATDSAIMVAARMSFMTMSIVRSLGMDNGCRIIVLNSNLFLNVNF